MTYEQRLDAATLSSYGIKISYPKLKALYKQHGVKKSDYEEPDSDRGKRSKTKRQIDQLYAMHLADLKILEHRLIYVDLVQACLEDLLLVFRPTGYDKSQEASDLESKGEKVWVQAAIDPTATCINLYL